MEKNTTGIQVFTRVEKGSEFKSFKGVMTVAASTDEILKILKNADGYTQWYGYTKTSKILRQYKGVQYNYVETTFPWPFNNRDMVYEMSIDSLNTEGVKVLLKGIPDYIEQKSGVTRMKKAEGYILLKPFNGSTEVIYVFHSEPGDDIPAWLANNSIVELPFKTLFGLREFLQE